MHRSRQGGKLVISPAGGVPGLYDAQLYNAEGILVREFSDLTVGQVRSVAAEYGASVEELPA